MAQRNPEETKIKILLTAEEEFARSGWYGARINSIAEKAGVNKRMIYHYYGSKEGLYQRVLEYNYQKILQIGNHILNTEDSIQKAVQEMIRRYFWFLYENPHYVKIVAWEEVLSSPFNKKTLLESLSPAFHQAYDFYCKGCKNGLFRQGIDLMQLIFSLHAMCFITFTRKEIILGGEENKALEARLQHILDMAFHMLRKEEVNCPGL